MSMSTTLTSNMFDSYAYSFKFINLEIPVILINDSSDLNHSSTLIVSVVFAFTKKKRRKKKEKIATHNLLQANHKYFVILVNVENRHAYF